MSVFTLLLAFDGSSAAAAIRAAGSLFLGAGSS